MPDIPYARYIDIVKLVTHLIQHQSEEGQGIGGKRLRQLCLDHYLDQGRLNDVDYVERKKTLITQVIRYMTKLYYLLDVCNTKELIVSAQGRNIESCCPRGRSGVCYSSFVQSSRPSREQARANQEPNSIANGWPPIPRNLRTKSAARR